MPDIHAEIRTPGKMEQRHMAVLRQQAAATKSRIMTRNTAIGAFLLLSAGMGWAVYNNNRLASIAYHRDTVYAIAQPNGEFVASTHYADITPAGKQENDVVSALWTYVFDRDCFGNTNFIVQAYQAQAMSDDTVAQRVRAEFNLDNPQAPQNVYGKHGIVVRCEPVDPAAPISVAANQYSFRFYRWEDDGHPVDPASRPIYTASVRYRTGVYSDDPRRAWLEKTTFNPPGVQVIGYTHAVPSNAAFKHNLRAEAGQ